MVVSPIAEFQIKTPPQVCSSPREKNMSLEKWSQNHLEGLLKHDVLTKTPEFLIRVDLGGT